MNTRSILVVGALFALLTFALIAQAVRISRLQTDLMQAETRLRNIEARKDAAPPAAPVDVEEIRKEIARVERKVDARPAAPAGSAPSGDALPTYLTEEDIARIVEEKIAARPGDGAKPPGGGEERGAFGERKLPLSTIAKDLGLDPGTEAFVADVANGAKKEMFEIIKTPRADGTNLADELVDGLLAGDQKKVQETFAKVFTDMLPGSNTTYLAALGQVQERAHTRLKETLDADTYMRFKHMNVDPNDIQTGYDPFEEYFQKRQ